MEFTSGNHMATEKARLPRRDSLRRRDDFEDDDGATWSISSNGGFSRSSHDDGLIFQR